MLLLLLINNWEYYGVMGVWLFGSESGNWKMGWEMMWCEFVFVCALYYDMVWWWWSWWCFNVIKSLNSVLFLFFNTKPNISFVWMSDCLSVYLFFCLFVCLFVFETFDMEISFCCNIIYTGKQKCAYTCRQSGLWPNFLTV